ncbi:MAG: CapA family protein [Ardenticatenaceae bacterium]|nr:CapA family protein [Ardenticatenaceae bacterium]
MIPDFKAHNGAVFLFIGLMAILAIIIGCTPATSSAEPDMILASVPTLQATAQPPATETPVSPIPSSTPVPHPPSPTPRPTTQPSPTPTATPTETPLPPSAVHIAAVGDIMLDRTLGRVIADGRLEYPFAAMAEELIPADITIGNLECALGDTGQPQEGKSYPFQAPPQAAEALAVGGFDIVSLANNHAMDYGPESLLQGIDLLQTAGVVPIGAGVDRAAAHAPHIIEANGQTVAFLAYVNVPAEVGGFDVETWDATDQSPGLAWGRLEEIEEDIAAVRSEVDHVIIVLHSGLEYVRFTDDVQRELARGAIDAGASAVIGHHAHILQGIERYNGGLIAYGLGNFAFDINGEPDTAVLHLWLYPDGEIDFELRPAVIQVGGAPRPATAEEAAEILKKIEEFLPLTNHEAP